MIYIYKPHGKKSLLDTLEYSNNFFITLEHIQDLKTNIINSKNNTFIIDYSDIINSNELLEIIETKQSNKYIVLASGYMPLNTKKYLTIIQKPYNIKELLSAISK